MENGVIAIGALGGSGTRICAQILRVCGVFMGTDLNGPNDNLLFTRLFKNPGWFEVANSEDIFRRLNIFQKCMKGLSLSDLENQEIIYASNTNPTFKSSLDYLSKANFIQSKDNNLTSEFWGWKEPNTQIYIEYIANFFPRLKYIQVIRHGLDMAFSNNKQQLVNWGYRFGIKLASDDTENTIINKQLDYWISSNRNAIEIGERLLGRNFYLLNYDSLCQDPSNEINRLMDFLEFEVSEELMEVLVNIPGKSTSTGRYLKEDLSIFSPEKIEQVKKMGFEVKTIE